MTGEVSMDRRNFLRSRRHTDFSAGIHFEPTGYSFLKCRAHTISPLGDRGSGCRVQPSARWRPVRVGSLLPIWRESEITKRAPLGQKVCCAGRLGSTLPACAPRPRRSESLEFIVYAPPITALPVPAATRHRLLHPSIHRGTRRAPGVLHGSFA